MLSFPSLLSFQQSLRDFCFLHVPFLRIPCPLLPKRTTSSSSPPLYVPIPSGCSVYNAAGRGYPDVANFGTQALVAAGHSLPRPKLRWSAELGVHSVSPLARWIWPPSAVCCGARVGLPSSNQKRRNGIETAITTSLVGAEAQLHLVPADGNMDNQITTTIQSLLKEEGREVTAPQPKPVCCCRSKFIIYLHSSRASHSPCIERKHAPRSAPSPSPRSL